MVGIPVHRRLKGIFALLAFSPLELQRGFVSGRILYDY